MGVSVKVVHKVGRTQLIKMSFNQLLRPVSHVAKQSRSMGGFVMKPNAEIVKQQVSGMDYLPKPSGSWKEANSKTQSKYNMYLAASAIAAFISIGIGVKENIFYLHDLKDYTKVPIDVSKLILLKSMLLQELHMKQAMKSEGTI